MTRFNELLLFRIEFLWDAVAQMPLFIKNSSSLIELMEDTPERMSDFVESLPDANEAVILLIEPPPSAIQETSFLIQRILNLCIRKSGVPDCLQKVITNYNPFNHLLLVQLDRVVI